MTPTPSKPDLVALAPCPFCGGKPTVEVTSADGTRSIYCDNDDCPAEARAHAQSFDVTVEDWNTRHTASQPRSYGCLGDEVSLADCPIGLFVSEDGELCLKTEYGNNEGRIDAYIVSTGEFFWGSQPQTIANQRAQLVRPIDSDTADRLASQSSSYEAGLRDMRERCQEAVRKVVENYKLLDGSKTLASTHAEKCLAAIAALPADGGEVDYDTNDPMGVEKDIQSSDGGCICCANGNDLPDGEYCRACGRENNLYPLAAAVKKARGIMAPPTKPVKFAGPSGATPSVREALGNPPFHFDRYINGKLMAEGVCIEKKETLNDAMVEAARIASKGTHGETPVLVYVPAALSAPVEAPVAYMVDGRVEQGLFFDKAAAEIMADTNCGNVVPLYATARPLPSVDRERILALVDSIRAQNWKNGGALAMDRDEAATAILTLLGGSVR